MDRIIVPLGNGYNLIAERNNDSEYSKEVYVGVETENGSFVQDLAIVRPAYHFENDKVVFEDNLFNILIFGNKDQDTYSEEFVVGLRQEEDDNDE